MVVECSCGSWRCGRGCAGRRVWAGAGKSCPRQEHAEPDGADGAGVGCRGALQEDRGGHGAVGCTASGSVPGLAGAGAGAHRGADPAALARGGDLAARGQRVLPRGLDVQTFNRLVRGAGRGVRAGDRPESQVETESGRGAGAGPAGVRTDGASGAGVQGLPLPDAGQLEPRAACDRQGGALAAGGQPAFRGDGPGPEQMAARAQGGTIRLKLLKLGVRIRVSVRAVRLPFDEGFPEAGLFGQLLARLQSLPLLGSAAQRHVATP